MKKKLLSKSNYVIGTRCPKSLYFKYFRPELATAESAKDIKAKKDGIEVGIAAREYFPKGILIESLDVVEAVAATKKDTYVDHFTRLLAIIGTCFPQFFIGILIMAFYIHVGGSL